MSNTLSAFIDECAATGLSRITIQQTTQAMQVSESNPMVGIEGRTSLLTNLSQALKASPTFFGEDARPGNLIGMFSSGSLPAYPQTDSNLDFLESESIPSGTSRLVPISALWHALIYGLSPIWPAARTSLASVSLGDVWPCSALKSEVEGEDLVPFHKLTGWITYSLIEPMEKILSWKFDGMEDMTGLPEYRNGSTLSFIFYFSPPQISH
jgi:hypothetical protein